MESVERRETAPATLVLAGEGDIKTLTEIERSVEKTKTYSPMVTEREWRGELSRCTVYIIKIGDTAAGSIAYEEKSPEHVYISGVIVRPEFQGRGLATQAIKEVLAKYPNATRIDLVTHPENPALALYESLGFEIEARKENYYGDGEPRLVLARVRKEEQ